MQNKLTISAVFLLLGIGLVGYFLFNPLLWFPEKEPQILSPEQDTLSEKPVYKYSINLHGRTPQGLSLFGNKLFVSYLNLNMIDILDYQGERQNMFVPFPQGNVNLVASAHDHSGNLYLVDAQNRSVLVFDHDNTFLGPFPPRKISSSTKDYLSLPFGVSIDRNFIYISDLGSGTVKAYLSGGEFVLGISGTGDDNSLQWHPINVAQTKDGRVLVSDIRNKNISAFSCAGKFAYFFEKNEEMGSDFLPGAIAIDGTSRIHVADNANSRIAVFDNLGKFLFTYGDRSKKTRRLKGPMNIVIDEAQHLIFLTNKTKQEIEVWSYMTPA